MILYDISSPSYNEYSKEVWYVHIIIIINRSLLFVKLLIILTIDIQEKTTTFLSELESV